MGTLNISSKNLLISETNEKGIISYANQQFCEVSGYTRDELIGKKHNIVRHNDMPKEIFAEMWKKLKKGKVWNGIIKNKRKDNKSSYWVNATIYQELDINKKIKYISVRTLASKKDVELAIIKYRRIKENSIK